MYLWSVNVAELQRRDAEGSGDEDQACDRRAVLTPKQADISRLNTKSHWKAEYRRTSRGKHTSTWATKTGKTSGSQTPCSSFDQSGPAAKQAVSDLENKTNINVNGFFLDLA